MVHPLTTVAPAFVEMAHRILAAAPPPVGYDPSVVRGWDSPTAPRFGILRLTPYRLRVMPGSLMFTREGELLTWRRRQG